MKDDVFEFSLPMAKTGYSLTCSLYPFSATETGRLEVTGTGEIKIRNTGGSSASEGGMGSDSDDTRSKGDLKKPDSGKGLSKSSDDDSETAFDPIKKNVREKEKGQEQ